MDKHTTHYACKEVMDRDGGKAVGCCCTGHECKQTSQEIKIIQMFMDAKYDRENPIVLAAKINKLLIEAELNKLLYIQRIWGEKGWRVAVDEEIAKLQANLNNSNKENE